MKKKTIITIILWLSIVCIFLIWDLHTEKEAHDTIALKTGQAFFEQMVNTRTWNAHHGGVYVPITEKTKPNPYLEDPLRDLNTDKGLKLTKINPAYMTRQISELSESKVKYHITSLKPIRPANKPSNWEKEYLYSFEKGAEEKYGFFPDGSFRYMAPLNVEKSCLECHEKQGYKLGQVRGGISVNLKNFPQFSNPLLLLLLGSIGLLGAIIIALGGFLLHKKQEQIVSRDEDIKKLGEIIPICSYCKNIRNDKGYWQQLEIFLLEHSNTKFSHGICNDCLQNNFPEYAEKLKKQ